MQLAYSDLLAKSIPSMVRASLPESWRVGHQVAASHEGRSTKAQPERRSLDPPTVDPPRESTKPDPGRTGERQSGYACAG